VDTARETVREASRVAIDLGRAGEDMGRCVRQRGAACRLRFEAGTSRRSRDEFDDDYCLHTILSPVGIWERYQLCRRSPAV